ncbi:MAG: hypothetical protein GY822_30450 [Deltaproteobacteria bacterium]|nr:hypothetical protein [Deltaproteobacteria bacterium]
MDFNIRRGQNTWRFDPLDRDWTVVTKNRTPGLQQEGEDLVPVGDNPFVQNPFTLPILDDAHVSTESQEVRAVALPSPTPCLAIEDPPPVFQPFQAEGALGAHEIIAPLLPDLDAAQAALVSAGDLNSFQWEAIWHVMLKRLWALSNDRRFLQARVLFPAISQRRLRHPHLHLLTLPLPTQVGAKDACPACADLQHARDRGRVILEIGDFLAWIPFAPRRGLHVRIGNAKHTHWMHDDNNHKDLTTLLQKCALALQEIAGGTDVCVAGASIPLNNAERGHTQLDLFVPNDVDDVFQEIGLRVCSIDPSRLAQELRELLSLA